MGAYWYSYAADIFLSTPSGWRATKSGKRRLENQAKFLSTPSGWRATIFHLLTHRAGAISIHALRVEGDSFYMLTGTGDTDISIHALRVEGDLLSLKDINGKKPISIHALRVEGDTPRIQTTILTLDFYPRPPGGGRLFKLFVVFVSYSRFLSTPSGWRATFCVKACSHVGNDFYPRPPGGGRQQKRTKFSSVFAQKGEKFASLRRGKRKICRWRFKKDKFWALIWCEGSGKSVCALASHCG